MENAQEKCGKVVKVSISQLGLAYLTFDRHISAAACTTNIDILRLNLGTEISNVSKYLSQFSLWPPPDIKLSHILVFAVFDGAHTAVFSTF